MYNFKKIYFFINYFFLKRILFHYGLSQDIEYSSLCYMVGPCCLSILNVNNLYLGFPGSSDGEESTYNAGDPGLIYILFLAVLGLRCCMSFTLVARAGATL